jgi:hypothetical protein
MPSNGPLAAATAATAPLLPAGPPAAAPAPTAAAAGISAGADAAPGAAAASPADPPLRAAERYLLQLFRAHLAPGRDQLLRFRQAMRGLSQLAAGHQAMVGFWADYEVRRKGRKGGRGTILVWATCASEWCQCCQPCSYMQYYMRLSSYGISSPLIVNSLVAVFFGVCFLPCFAASLLLLPIAAAAVGSCRCE